MSAKQETKNTKTNIPCNKMVIGTGSNCMNLKALKKF